MRDTLEVSRRTLRLPQDAADFLDRIATKNCTSVNAEIVRSVREMMERHPPSTKTAPERGATRPEASPGA